MAQLQLTVEIDISEFSDALNELEKQAHTFKKLSDLSSAFMAAIGPGLEKVFGTVFGASAQCIPSRNGITGNIVAGNWIEDPETLQTGDYECERPTGEAIECPEWPRPEYVPVSTFAESAINDEN